MYPPLRRWRDALPQTRDGLSPASMSIAREEFSYTWRGPRYAVALGGREWSHRRCCSGNPTHSCIQRYLWYGFELPSSARVILEVSIVPIGSDTSLERGARTVGWMGSTHGCERVRSAGAISVVKGCLTRRETSLFSPPFCVILWSMVVFLKEVYDRARSDKFILSQQPALKHTWNTMVVTLF